MRMIMVKNVAAHLNLLGRVCSFEITAQTFTVKIGDHRFSFDLEDLDESPHPFSDITATLDPFLSGLERPREPVPVCGAVVQGDERFCAPCNLRWGSDEKKPDTCRAQDAAL